MATEQGTNRKLQHTISLYKYRVSQDELMRSLNLPTEEEENLRKQINDQTQNRNVFPSPMQLPRK